MGRKVTASVEIDEPTDEELDRLRKAAGVDAGGE